MLTGQRLLIPQHEVIRRPPLNMKKEDKKFFEHEFRQVLPDVCQFEFRDVNVSYEGVIFKYFRRYPQNLIDPSCRTLRYLLSKYLKNKKLALSDKEKYLLAFDYWSATYFHWMCDVLPRLFTVKDQLHEKCMLIPQSYLDFAYVNKTLSVFGIKKLQPIPPKHYVSVPRLSVPGWVTPTGHFNIEVMKGLKQMLLDYYKNDNRFSDFTRVYVSRRKAKYRYLINEEAVIELVTKYGFKVVSFEDYSYEEQVSIMRNCRCLIGIIGANLANMIYMNEGGSVLEFTQKGNSHDNCYFSLANVFNHDFLYQFCEFEDTIPGAYWNLLVDLQKLDENIQLMLSRKK